MGGREIRMKPCKWCKKPLVQRSWWRPKRYCNRWHQVKYRVLRTVEDVIESA